MTRWLSDPPESWRAASRYAPVVGEYDDLRYHSEMCGHSVRLVGEPEAYVYSAFAVDLEKMR